MNWINYWFDICDFVSSISLMVDERQFMKKRIGEVFDEIDIKCEINWYHIIWTDLLQLGHLLDFSSHYCIQVGWKACLHGSSINYCYFLILSRQIVQSLSLLIAFLTVIF